MEGRQVNRLHDTHVINVDDLDLCEVGDEEAALENGEGDGGDVTVLQAILDLPAGVSKYCVDAQCMY
jgi:hypothetical protein